jgi:hypothetical protein
VSAVLSDPLPFSFTSFVEAFEACGDDFANDMERIDKFRIVEPRFKMPHDEPGGPPRFVV